MIKTIRKTTALADGYDHMFEVHTTDAVSTRTQIEASLLCLQLKNHNVPYIVLSPDQTIVDAYRSDELPSIEGRICEYCHDAPAMGYVKAYKSHVCDECYEEHHGPIE